MAEFEFAVHPPVRRVKQVFLGCAETDRGCLSHVSRFRACSCVTVCVKEWPNPSSVGSEY